MIGKVVRPARVEPQPMDTTDLIQPDSAPRAHGAPGQPGMQPRMPEGAPSDTGKTGHMKVIWGQGKVGLKSCMYKLALGLND